MPLCSPVPWKMYVDFAAEEALEFDHEGGVVKEAGILTPCHQKINVADGTIVSARDGPDQTHLCCAVCRAAMRRIASRCSWIVLLKPKSALVPYLLLDV